MLTRTQLAKELGVHPNTVDNYVKSGMPKYQKCRNGKVLFDLQEVREWMKK